GAPVVETISSLTLSALLGSRYGLNGILAGIIITQMAVIVVWKPYYLISRRMAGFGAAYTRLFISHLVAGTIAATAIGLTLSHTDAGIRLTEIASQSTAGFIVAAATTSTATALLLAAIMASCFKPFRQFAGRILRHRS
ncbi:MAG: hypothetical protein K2I34_03840, partial [Paramuribaculum sp.]|nr:hypothetical protein [Paramuribaculum sp.]